MSTTDTHDRNIAHEVTAVTEGHRAYLAHDARGWHVRIVSDTIHGKTWKVRALTNGPGYAILFDCDPDGTRRAGHRHVTRVDGTLTCKHAGLAARRLERAGLARFVPAHVDGDIVRRSQWVATDKVTDPRAIATLADETTAPAAPAPADDDPFAGLPSY